jgi:predicted TIM-barrel fold metal-dependent hydrolase
MIPPSTQDGLDLHLIQDRFPFCNNPVYRPGKAIAQALLEFEKSIGVEKYCPVSVSIYGTDNRSIADAMQYCGPDCKAVVTIDPEDVTEEQLNQMHEFGVRGLRLNFKSKGESPGKEELEATSLRIAALVKSWNWLIQLYLGLSQVQLIVDLIPTLGVRVVLDHMASPDPKSATSSQPGYAELMQLLRNGMVFVKISGTYRFPGLPDLDKFARGLIRAGSQNTVWASDWPHTGGPVAVTGGKAYSSYRQIDTGAFIRKCFEWCDHDERLIQNLFVNNPRALWLG